MGDQSVDHAFLYISCSLGVFPPYESIHKQTLKSQQFEQGKMKKHSDKSSKVFEATCIAK